MKRCRGVTFGKEWLQAPRQNEVEGLQVKPKEGLVYQGQCEIALWHLWMGKEGQMARVLRAVCQGAMWAGGSLGTREARLPGATPGSGRAGPCQPAPIPLLPAREQGNWEAAGGSHIPGHRAPLWRWVWAKARLGHQPTAGRPGQDQHGHRYEAARDVTPKRRGLSDIRVMRGSPQLLYWKVGSDPQQPNLQEGEGCGQGLYMVLLCNNLSKHHPTRHAELSSRGSLPFLQQIQVCSGTQMDRLL